MKDRLTRCSIGPDAARAFLCISASFGGSMRHCCPGSCVRFVFISLPLLFLFPNHRSVPSLIFFLILPFFTRRSQPPTSEFTGCSLMKNNKSKTIGRKRKKKREREKSSAQNRIIKATNSLYIYINIFFFLVKYINSLYKFIVKYKQTSFKYAKLNYISFNSIFYIIISNNL